MKSPPLFLRGMCCCALCRDVKCARYCQHVSTLVVAQKDVVDPAPDGSLIVIPAHPTDRRARRPHASHFSSGPTDVAEGIAPGRCAGRPMVLVGEGTRARRTTASRVCSGRASFRLRAGHGSAWWTRQPGCPTQRSKGGHRRPISRRLSVLDGRLRLWPFILIWRPDPKGRGTSFKSLRVGLVASSDTHTSARARSFEPRSTVSLAATHSTEQ